MGLNLPPILPSRSSGVSTPKFSGHAQNFSVSKLQQKKDRENSKVSMGQVSRIKSDGGGGRPITSVNMNGGVSLATTSISHQGQAKHSVYDEEYADEVRDRLRYQYIRKKIMERKIAEAAVGKSEPSKYKVSTGIGTGVGFSRKLPGAQSAERSLYRKVTKEKATLKNLSKKDREYFLDMVEGHAKKLPTGKGFNKIVRKKMKIQVNQDRKRGIISGADVGDFRKMIDELPH